MEPTSPGLWRSTIMSAPQAVARLCTVASEADRSPGDRPLEEQPPAEREWVSIGLHKGTDFESGLIHLKIYNTHRH